MQGSRLSISEEATEYPDDMSEPQIVIAPPSSNS